MNDYRGLFDDWSYWSSHGSGGTVEVDFLLRRGKRFIAVEAKAGRRFKPEMLKGLQAVADLAGVERRILVYAGSDSWTTDDRIEAKSPAAFAALLNEGF